MVHPFPSPLVVRCGSGFGCAVSPSAPLWCGVVHGLGRPGCFEIVIIIVVIIVILIVIVIFIIINIISTIIIMFLFWVNCHKKRAWQVKFVIKFVPLAT
ncbi:hypothetical protein AK812_SmicGene2820 [Symbiodinium microadriaticum]|uniref:Uncharacterized protein n=1 Tax=Symbiodinium microadriaticum TaxID=2951 RepID=A0A1Q9F0J0_SYMMI|nr:hypothetical protein AK812_SmicGene2820 [Symbiodinium microadriaticum]